MSSFAVKLQCPNPECLYTDNQIGQPVCNRCQSHLTYRYLWTVGAGAAQMAPGSLIDCRYLVISPQIWLDTQPGLLPKVPLELPDRALPYLHLHPHRLHLPGLFAIHQPDDDQPPIFLLENAPINSTGKLQPLLEVAWASALAVRQLNWLWQMFQLWPLLEAQGVATSLLVSENLHVEGWRLCLRELIADQVVAESQMDSQFQDTKVPALAGVAGAQPISYASRPIAQPTYLPLTSSFFTNSSTQPSLQDLAEVWQTWLEDAHPSIQADLQQICEAMRLNSDTQAHRQQIADRLNQLLLTKAAERPLRLEMSGDTTTGTQRTHNEDACFPLPNTKTTDSLLPYVGIICDGIGGHEGGEVASQMALRSLQLQLRTWLAELQTQPEPLPPRIIEEQLLGVVRVVNNLIAAQNDTQGREDRQRMATTLVMAIQSPQPIQTPQLIQPGNSHELYLVHVGDSRAYWLTPQYCQQLTVDDDVTTREVRTGRSLYSQAVHRADASALTQALGTREGNLLKVTVQRFVVDEDGILLLCSDGLSDNGLVEQLWETLTQPLLQEKLSLQKAVQECLTLADRHNGHDNASIVLMQCRLGDKPRLFEPRFGQPLVQTLVTSTTGAKDPTTTSSPDELTESSKALLYDETPEAEPPKKAAVLPKRQKPPQKAIDVWIAGLGITALMFVLGALGVAVWRELASTGFRPGQPFFEVPKE